MLTLIVLATLLLAPVVVYGKRVPPKPVKPVVANGVTYSADGDGRAGYIIATENATGKELWRTRVYSVHIKFWMEEDVQWVYITNLKIVGNSLLIRNETSRCYDLDLTKRKSKQISCPMDWQTADDK